MIALGAALAAFIAGAARAQLPTGATTQFDVVGFVQEATLDSTCATNAHCGGTIKVNGHLITVPKEIVVMFPANALTWQEMFAQAPAPYGLLAAGGPMSGMASADLPAPLSTYEAHVVGNRVIGGPAGADLYIAALIFVSQQSLNSGAGFINFIDYALGEMRVGGVIGDANCTQGVINPLCSGARVRINDPVGRYGRINSPDVRFTVDSDNPTIMSGTGFPMCLPRFAPPPAPPNALSETDLLCPQGQRYPLDPLGNFVGTVNMNDPTNPGLVGVAPDPFKQVPFEVGDYVTFAGTLVKDAPAGGFLAGDGPTVGPWPLAAAGGSATTYVSAHTIVNNIAVYTVSGTDPAYVMIDTALIGTGGLSVLGAGEAVIRTRFEGMATDTGRLIHLYAIDTDPSGATADRDYGTIAVDPGPTVGAVKGRWRFRPPCLTNGSVPTKPDKQCVMNAAGTFLPPTRELRAVIQGAWVPGQTTTAANGLIYGQYHAPIFEYIFPENIPGTPIVANNFNTIPFLTAGGYTTSGGTIVGQLNPWPDIVVPTPTCALPSVNTGGPYTVPAGGTIKLAGSGTGGAGAGTAPTLLWTVTSGTLSNATIYDPIFNSVGAVSPITATLTASACGSSASATTTITINTASVPTVNPVAPITLFSGASSTVVLSGSDANVPLTESLLFTVNQSGVLALLNLLVTPTTPSSANLTFTAPTLPVGQVTPAVITLTITATDTSGLVSAPASTSVTVNPLPDVVTITIGQYRTSKQRLDVTATSSVISPNVVLTLQPYKTTTGANFNPSTLGNVFTNTGNGIYTLTLVGAPQPAATPGIQAKSNLNGLSNLFTVSVRQ